MVSTSGGGELDTRGLGRYPVAGVEGQGVVTAVDRNAFVEVVLNEIAEVGTSDAESRSPGRSTSTHTAVVSLTRMHMKSEWEKRAGSIQRR
jgi:hypothetical protein